MDDIVEKINQLKNDKNAIILAHYYQDDAIQDIADFVGDSLALAQRAAETDADMIVFAGVHFMAETAKILNPSKKVLLPDLNAGCSLADSCPPDEFEAFKNRLRKNMDDLYKIMKKHGYENADNEFLSHVVGKGKLFFYNVVDDPEFAIYLFAGEAQDLWSVVSS